MNDIHFEPVEDEKEIYSLIDRYEQYLIPTLKERGINIQNYAQKLCQYGKTYVACTEKKTIGCATIYANDLKKKTGYLSFIAIDPSAQGMGIGGQFLFFLEDKIKEFGMKKLSLEVHSGNTNSIAFYKHFGYQPSDDTEADSFHMIKEL
jgi:N-acetylglutamate synthase-like GNAT family acetyltransferase